MTAKICRHVLGLRRQNLIGLCLRRKYVIYSIFKNQMYDVMNVL